MQIIPGKDDGNTSEALSKVTREENTMSQTAVGQQQQQS